MNYPEILAPAGSPEALVAAVRCGADAVYLGGKSLNARRGAGNFDDSELADAADYCHTRGVRLYLTLNTLVADNEIEEAISIIKRACAIGADALILQDIGLSRLVHEMSDIPMHASTQMSVQTPHGLQLLKSMGFCRAVLPRELSEKEIGTILASTPLETEMFVHGALCMSVSGQCYMSAFFGSRSGNRGLCAQPCRLPFAAPGGTGNDLSLKDLSLLDSLQRLSAMGIDSFKIEGRMKRPEYVAAAVTACKMALDGAVTKDISDSLKSVFSRSGFTDGYYSGKRGKGMFGTRRHEDVTATAPVLSGLSRLYEKEPQTISVSFRFECTDSSPVKLSAVSGGIAAFAESRTLPSPALSRPLTADAVNAQLKKCGGTPFFVSDISCDIRDGLNVPLSEINFLRRETLRSIEEKLCRSHCRSFTPSIIKKIPHSADSPVFYARFSSATQIPQNIGAVSKIIFPLCCSAEDFTKYSAATELPRGIFGDSDKILSKLSDLKAAGVTEAVCHTLDAFALASKAGFAVIAGHCANIYNAVSVAEAERLGASECVLSAELTAHEVSLIGGNMRRGVFAYGRIPLMLTRNCPAANGKSCAQCRQHGSITDRKGITFPIDCKNGCPEILNSRPIYMADKLGDIKNTDFFLLYFTTEERSVCEDIIEAYRSSEAPRGEFTRGLFYRGAL